MTDDIKEEVAKLLKAIWLAGNLIKRVCPDEVPIASLKDIASEIHSLYTARIEQEVEEAICGRDKRIWELEKELEGYQGWARSVNEALNSGDGNYRP